MLPQQQYRAIINAQQRLLMETVFLPLDWTPDNFGNILPHRGADGRPLRQRFLANLGDVAAGNAGNVGIHGFCPSVNVACRCRSLEWSRFVEVALRQFNRHALTNNTHPAASSANASSNRGLRRIAARPCTSLHCTGADRWRQARVVAANRHCALRHPHGVGHAQAPAPNRAAGAARITMAAPAVNCSGWRRGQSAGAGAIIGCLARAAADGAECRQYLPR